MMMMMMMMMIKMATRLERESGHRFRVNLSFVLIGGLWRCLCPGDEHDREGGAGVRAADPEARRHRERQEENPGALGMHAFLSEKDDDDDDDADDDNDDPSRLLRWWWCWCVLRA
jgi:hypothetical protein